MSPWNVNFIFLLPFSVQCSWSGPLAAINIRRNGNIRFMGFSALSLRFHHFLSFCTCSVIDARQTQSQSLCVVCAYRNMKIEFKIWWIDIINSRGYGEREASYSCDVVAINLVWWSDASWISTTLTICQLCASLPQSLTRDEILHLNSKEIQTKTHFLFPLVLFKTKV